MSNNWQNKIYNHEETPPNNAWENIAKKLDEIDGKTSIKTEVKKSKIIYLRLAAAACIAAIIATTAIWLYNSNTQTTNDIAKITPKNNQIENTIQDTVSDHNIENSKSTNPGKTNAVAQKNPTLSKKKSVDKNDVSAELQYVNAGVVKPLTGNPISNKTEKLVGTTGEVINDIALMNSPNSYVSFVGPNGQEVKVSSKFSNLLGYMDGRDPETVENLDKIISESNFWRGKFKSWRNKMISNNNASSPANFMNIIELSKLLNEE